MRPFLGRFLNEDDGATAIEYGLICALICIVILSGLSALGSANGGLYAVMRKIADALAG
ncbi:Flp family type IVb pilin [Brevundimonas sp.]|jgi:pilus assembly protein Flp/PilA|uniref:Flp family type IVb pilin n=1 Tax=Brevundimonas sp. TaxID=1871086 RepID=UPI0037BEDE26